MINWRLVRSGLSAGAVAGAAFLGACSTPEPAGPSGVTPSFLIGPGESLWDFVDENSTPNGLGGTCDAPASGGLGRCAYNNSRIVPKTGFGSITLTAQGTATP